MTAAAARAELAAIGGDLAELTGGPGWRRARALLGEAAQAPVGFADLRAAPAWLRRSRAELERLAAAAGLIAMGPAVAASIDGGWLRELRDRADDRALDDAIALAGRVPEGGLPPLPASAVLGLGFDLLRAALPPALHRYLDWAPVGSIGVGPTLATFCAEQAAAA